jgi:hypothetical protein
MATTCEETLSLRMPFLKRRGFLRLGYGSTLSWSRNGQTIARVGITALADAIVLRFTHSAYGRDPQLVEQRVPIVRTSCNYGGTRPWFLCRCGRRAGVIYLSGSPVFACRRCYRLCYGSQIEAQHYRLMSKAHRLRQKLTGTADGWGEEPTRPKGMHRRTFDRLLGKLDACEEAADLAALVRFGRYL